MRRIARLLTSTALVLLFLAFASANLEATWHDRSPTGAGLTVLAGWTAVLFLSRRTPSAVSMMPLAWAAALIGTFGDLLARPVDATGVAHVGGELIQLVGVVMALISLTALGRSFGLVAANRGVRSGGPYRLVRHPVYASYCVAWAGYFLESPTTRNFLVFGVVFVAQLVRIREEESVLGRDADYRSYMSAVRARLVPFVY